MNVEAKKEGKKGDEDLSMEEILQSIRKIIAEDDDGGDKGKKNGMADKGENDGVPGSDVLELTEMLKEDGTVVSLKPEAAAAPAAPAPAAAAGGDVLNKIDEALAPKAAEKPAEKPVEKPAEKPAAAAPAPAAAAPAPAPAAPATAPAAAPLSPQAEADALLSAAAAKASADEFKRLHAAAEPPLPPVVTTPSPTFSSGLTVETMVMDMLKPMMKSWLDVNLPAIVERIVEREVRKITKH